MCRLLGVVSRAPRPLLDVVPDELPLFTALSERHKDGWGVSSDGAPGDPPPVRRSTGTARAEGAYAEALAEAHGRVMTVHLRRASVGLARELRNTHPFVEGRLSFAHNGQFDLTDALRERVLARGGRIPGGTTDSELFLSLVTACAREDGIAAGDATGTALAVQRAAEELTAWTLELSGRVPESLNCLLTLPGALVAYAAHDPAQAPADQPREVYDLRYGIEQERVVVTSTGYPLRGAGVLGQGEALVVEGGEEPDDPLRTTFLPARTALPPRTPDRAVG